MSRSIKIAKLFKIASETITSFDFDDTIRSSITGELNQNIVQEIMSANANGKVYLVTARQDTPENKNFVFLHSTNDFVTLQITPWEFKNKIININQN